MIPPREQDAPATFRPGRSASLRARLATCALAAGLATWLSLAALFSNGCPVVSAPAGLALAYLLVSPRRLWPHYSFAAGAGIAAAAMLSGIAWKMSFLFIAFSVAQALLAAALLRWLGGRLPQFNDRPYLLRSIAVCALAAPLTVTLLFAWFSGSTTFSHPLVDIPRWFASGALGLTLVPLFWTTILRQRFRMQWRTRELAFFALLLAGCIVIVAQSAIPLLSLVFPLLALVLLELGLEWAALATLLTGTMGGALRIAGLWPAARDAGATELQLALASVVILLAAVSMVIESFRATQQAWARTVSFHHMLMDTSGDMILLKNFEGRIFQISTAVRAIAGWEPCDALRRSSFELAHPDDRASLRQALAELRDGAEGALLEYRMRRCDASYVWVEASLWPVRDPMTQTPVGVLHIARDISRRKQDERQLEEAYRTLESLAITDPLTRLANRRHFDECFEGEWRRAMREREPISLLLLDVDLFKSFNDTYGHLAGDECLRKVAEAAQEVVRRPGDVVARYGGEEFAVVLPRTPQAGAAAVARNIAGALAARRVQHDSNPTGYVTVSIGCITWIPALGEASSLMIQQADEALYAAKAAGKNRVQTAEGRRVPLPLPVFANLR